VHKIKLAALISLAILFGGMFSGAAAQKRMPPILIEPPVGALSGIYKISVEASELSSGVTDSLDGTTYGWTWNGKTDGDLSGFIFLSLNWTPEISVNDLEVLAVRPGTINGGSWSKLIFIKGQYVGSISGTIVGGEVSWSEKYQIATVSLQMIADEGTDMFAGSVGTATFDGILDQSGKKPTLSGTLILNY